MPKDQIVVAAIDLGSNSLRLLIGSRNGGGLLCLSKQRALVSLAAGLDNNAIFSPETTAQALKAIARFRTEIDRFNVVALRCCGTATFRKASNPELLTAPAAKILGVPIEVLSGEEEAQLCCLGVTNTLSDKLSFPCLIIDVGGGSTELILLRSSQCQPVIRSLPLGVVALADHNQPYRTQGLEKLRAEIREILNEGDSPSPPMLVATGGTAGSLAALDLGLANHQFDKIQGHFLSRVRLDCTHDSLAALGLGQRRNIRGLESGRDKLLLPGLEIYQEVLATIGCAGMIVSDAGLLEGLLLSITGA